MRVSYLCILMSQTIFLYVTLRSCGTCDFVMNNIVFYPSTLLPTPCECLPNSLDKYLCYTIFSSLLTKCLYSFENKVLLWMAEFICNFLGKKLHMEWLCQCVWKIIWIFSELGINVVVVQNQLVFQWNYQWHNFFWRGTIFMLGLGFVVILVPPLELVVFIFYPRKSWGLSNHPHN